MIKEFLSFKDHCPLCRSQLNLTLSTAKARDAEVEGDYLKIQFDLGGYPNSQASIKTKFILYISTIDATILVDSYNSKDILYEKCVPINEVTKIFNILNRTHQIHKSCQDCKRYGYSSGHFAFELRGKDCKFIMHQPILSERISLEKNANDGIYNYEVYNYPKGKSVVYFGKISIKQLKELRSNGTIGGIRLNPLALPGSIVVPNLDFKDPDTLLSKIETLIVFN